MKTVENEIKAYITYPNDSKICGILLSESRRIGHSIYYKDKKIVGYKKSIPNDVLKDLEDMGAIIEKSTFHTNIKKVNLFGIKGTSSRAIKTQGASFIRIRVEAVNLESLMIKISDIKYNMEKYGYKPKTCIWNRMGRYDANNINEDD